MSAPAHAISIEHEVPFHDTDALAIVWHGNYYKYFGMASTELFRSRGLLPTDLEALGVVLVVAESRCRHSFPLRYTDRFRVRAWFEDVDLRVNISYEIHNLTHGKRSARGRTILVSLDRTGALLYATPPALRDRLIGPAPTASVSGP